MRRPPVQKRVRLRKGPEVPKKPPTPPPAPEPAPADPAWPPPPDHLLRSAVLWDSVLESYDLEDHQLELLRRLCEASDDADAARALVKAEGMTVTDRFDQRKPHPAVDIERHARLNVARLMRELRLEGGDDDPRLPRLPE